MQNQPEPEHVAEQPDEGEGEPVTIASGEPIVKKDPRCQPKRGYFRKFKNWVSYLTLLFVGIYTVITIFIFCVAQEQTKISNKAFVMSQRAFVYFIPPTFAGDNPAIQKFDILVGIGNSGNTPTRELSYEMDCKLVDVLRSFIFATEKITTIKTSTIIGPKLSPQLPVPSP